MLADLLRLIYDMRDTAPFRPSLLNIVALKPISHTDATPGSQTLLSQETYGPTIYSTYYIYIYK